MHGMTTREISPRAHCHGRWKLCLRPDGAGEPCAENMRHQISGRDSPELQELMIPGRGGLDPGCSIGTLCSPTCLVPVEA